MEEAGLCCRPDGQQAHILAVKNLVWENDRTLQPRTDDKMCTVYLFALQKLCNVAPQVSAEAQAIVLHPLAACCSACPAPSVYKGPETSLQNHDYQQPNTQPVSLRACKPDQVASPPAFAVPKLHNRPVIPHRGASSKHMHVLKCLQPHCDRYMPVMPE